MKADTIGRGILVLTAAGLALAARADLPIRAEEAIRPPAICLAPGTPKAKAAELEKFYAQQRPPNGFQFDDFDGWDFTATNPGPRVAGDPMTIRWSIVPDGTVIGTGGIPGESTAGSNLKAFLNGIYGNQGVWQPIIANVFADWGGRTGVTYVFEPNDDGAASPGSPGVINVRGDVRIGGHFIDGNSNVLAYNYFPNSGDMVIDTGDGFYASDAANFGSLGFKNMLAHEHGHGLGLEHVCPLEETKLMEPIISYMFSGPQHDDTLAGNRGYGDDREPNDFSGAPNNLGALANGPTNLTGLSIDDDSDVDFYKFTVLPGRRVDVTVTPVGFTYLQGPQVGDCSTGSAFNSLVQSDLLVQVIGTDGSTVLATGNSAGPGVAEVLNDVTLGAGGTYFIRVAGGANAAQLYNLSLNLENLPATLSVNDVSVPEQSGPANFTVSLSQPAAATVTVQYATAPNTATSPADFTATTNTLTFLTGETTKTVPVTIVNDITDEPNETFFLNLSNPTNSSITDAQGVGTIVDDDPNADLSVTVTDGVQSATPAQVLAYTIVVSNAGPNAAPGSSVSVPLPSGLIGATWTCVSAGGSACGAANGVGGITDSPNLAVGGTVTYTLNATVAPNPQTVRVQATVAVPAGFGEPNPANNVAVDDDLLACDPYKILMGDGRPSSGSLNAGATAWYLAGLHIGSSYSIEVTNELGQSLPTVVVVKGDDGCTGTPATLNSTVGIDAAAPSSFRGSLTASGNDGRYRIKVTNNTGSTMAYTIRVVETTLFSATFSTNSTFNTFYSFQNTTSSTVNGVITLRDTTGAVVGTAPLSIPGGRTGAANTVSLAVPRSKTGTAQFTHDGPPGAINGESDIANFTSTPAFIQPVKMLPARER